MTERLMRHLRGAMRAIRQSPGFAGMIVLTLSLGVAVNAAAFAAAYAVLIRPLPYASSERIVVLNLLFPDGGDLGFSPSDTPEWLHRLSGVDAVAAYYTRDVTIRTQSRSTVQRAAFVTEGFFDVFGAVADGGRLRLSSDAPTLAVARSRVAEALGVDVAQALGTAATIGATPRTVNALVPSEFAFPSEAIGIWLPYRVKPLEGGYSKIVARLRPGVTLAQFRDDAGRVFRELKGDSRDVVSVMPLGDSIVGATRRLLVAFMAGSLLVLGVACANVATLVVGRDVSRRREFATRLAVGAERVDLVGGVLAEMCVLAFLAALVGVPVGAAALAWFTSIAAAEFPRLLDARIDVPVVAAIVSLTLAAACLSAVVPAWYAAHGDFTAFLRPTSTSRPAAWKVRRLLVIVQIACCCMLLIGAGLLMRTIAVLSHQDAGFDPHRALAAKLVLSDLVLGGSDRSAFVRALVERARALPGVQEAGFGSTVPPRTPPVTMSIELENNGTRQSRLVKVASATPGFLPALGTRFLAGRDFADSDAQSSVVVLSESLARFYFGGRDPIGLTFSALPAMFGVTGTPRVIGVVSDMKYDGLDAPLTGAIYLPWTRRPFGTGYVVIRTRGDTQSILPEVRRAVAALDPTVPVPELLALDDITSQSIAGRRIRAIPASAFALLALAVAAVGVMATLSTLVAERRRDLAICSALGASSARLMWTIASDGLALTAGGVVAGLAGGLIVAHGLSSLLYGVTPSDPITFAATGALVVVASMLMTAAGASRAIGIEPINALRQE